MCDCPLAVQPQAVSVPAPAVSHRAALSFPDAWSELPHFSSAELVSRHAVLESLDFLFYLLHGRPAFAFGTFLGQQLARSKTPRQL